MTFCNCGNRRDCTGIALVASLIIGIIATFLQITAVFTLTPVYSIVALGIAVVYLAVVLLTNATARKDSSCNLCCTPLSALLFGIAGTIFVAIVLLLIEFAATSIIGAIFVGALFFFFALTIFSTICLIRCLLNCEH